MSCQLDSLPGRQVFLQQGSYCQSYVKMNLFIRLPSPTPLGTVSLDLFVFAAKFYDTEQLSILYCFLGTFG